MLMFRGLTFFSTFCPLFFMLHVASAGHISGDGKTHSLMNMFLIDTCINIFAVGILYMCTASWYLSFFICLLFFFYDSWLKLFFFSFFVWRKKKRFHPSPFFLPVSLVCFRCYCTASESFFLCICAVVHEHYTCCVLVWNCLWLHLFWKGIHHDSVFLL